ncbi:wax ester synthase/diacylglycerol acyltransferase 11-like [Rutidosis leptorrhynchoides]|uniref:wax ester synthase/diacylglycerol acyltransferase 11-like n=1 Tax=Rutidosis leptorrhynchoides TaxID=125765 RepID=UPI003A98EB99
MESLTSGLRWRQSTLKPIQITENYSFNIAENSGYEGEPLSPDSRMFHEPNLNVYNIAILGIKYPINPAILYEKLPHALLKHPHFCSLQVVDDKNEGEMKWVPTNVNLDNHIIIPTIPQNLNSPDTFLEDYVFNLSKTSINASKPLWDLHLLNLKTSGAEAIALFRIHQSLGDGTSLISWLLACSRQISNPDAVPTIPTNKGSNSGWLSSNNLSVPGPWWQRWYMAVGLVFWLVLNTLVDVGNFMLTALYLKDTETPIKVPVGDEFNPRRLVYRTVSLDDMKLIKNAMNLTINDVALGITQAGLSQYLNRKYGNLKKDEGATEKKNNLPKKNIRLRSLLLINLTPSSGIQALADMMEKNTEAKWGNSLGYILLPFTIGIRDDPLDYIREAKVTIDRKKRSLEAIYTFSIAKFVYKFFGIKVASSLSHKIMSRTTLSFSNLVGPLEEIGFYGHHMEFIASGSYGQPHGLMINFQSYVNKMTIVLSVEENTIPDPHKLLDDFEGSLKLIKEAVYARGLLVKENTFT